MIPQSIEITSICPGCGYELPVAYFRGGEQCDTCRDTAATNKPWTDADLARMRRAVSLVSTYFSIHFDGMSEPERELFRDLMDAVDRRRWRAAV
jgi:hypothetical protein